jgi:diguanylate cyclase (GGDEF)-like protein
MRQLSIHDGLTGLYNRRFMDEVLNREFQLSQRTGHPFAVILFDVDTFKSVNATHGHEVGDKVLIQIAQILPQHFRVTDFCFRYGGDEFLILMPDTTLPVALERAENLRMGMAASEIEKEGAVIGDFSLSIGVAQYTPPGREPADILADADRALYTAKAAGRNRVCAAEG